MSNSISENLEVERDETLDAGSKIRKNGKTRAEGRGAGPEVGIFLGRGRYEICPSYR